MTNEETLNEKAKMACDRKNDCVYPQQQMSTTQTTHTQPATLMLTLTSLLSLRKNLTTIYYVEICVAYESERKRLRRQHTITTEFTKNDDDKAATAQQLTTTATTQLAHGHQKCSYGNFEAQGCIYRR
ncbi:unnamed protein product [Ceratitis capitata]|uniref:(Mediterranean fruit fly) hypothetical protein n=1 Tax=Ceratitis capitata TaxID=7213 RepID=A0A811VDB2_CERCA|nr:unnamed protein product [Ceratitis capitata]